MARAAVDHTRAERIAQAATGGFSEVVLQRDIADMDPGALRVARQHDPFTSAGSAERDRQATILATRLESRHPAPTTRGRTVTKASYTPAEPRPADRYHLATALDSSRDLDCLTSAVYFEARGESPRGQAAVAQVVLNRVRHPSFPKTVCGVVFQGAARHTGCQFSFACDGSMHRGREANAWNRARKVAAGALSGVVLADVGAATHFHTTNVAPGWGPRMLRVAQVGLHVFYRFNARGHAPALADQPVFASTTPDLAAPTEFRLASALVVVDKPADAAAAQPASVATPAPVADAKVTPAKPADAAPAGLTKASGDAPKAADSKASAS
ncbi:MAG: cell wall hydrolase [Phenylobacterium sp.]